MKTAQEVDDFLNTKDFIKRHLENTVKVPDFVVRKGFMQLGDKINEYVPDLVNTNINVDESII